MALDAIDSIKTFWEDRARNREFGEDIVTHPDFNQRLLEVEVLEQYLPRGQSILDIGCGNGFSTAIFAKYAAHVVGIDYSPAMIERAKHQFGHLSNVDFELKDVANLEFSPKSFDVVISQRCLINLPTWEAQQKAISDIASVLRTGGYFFLQEGTQQGRERLNQVREMLGLKRMPDVPYNLDFDEEQLWPFVHRYFGIVEVRRFGIYDLVSRVVHPLLVSPLEPKYNAEINRIARQVSSKLPGLDELSREFSAFLRRLD
jgi:SAM-dependent methyltransferase